MEDNIKASVLKNELENLLNLNRFQKKDFLQKSFAQLSNSDNKEESIENIVILLDLYDESNFGNGKSSILDILWLDEFTRKELVLFKYCDANKELELFKNLNNKDYNINHKFFDLEKRYKQYQEYKKDKAIPDERHGQKYKEMVINQLILDMYGEEILKLTKDKKFSERFIYKNEDINVDDELENIWHDISNMVDQEIKEEQEMNFAFGSNDILKMRYYSVYRNEMPNNLTKKYFDYKVELKERERNKIIANNPSLQPFKHNKECGQKKQRTQYKTEEEDYIDDKLSIRANKQLVNGNIVSTCLAYQFNSNKIDIFLSLGSKYSIKPKQPIELFKKTKSEYEFIVSKYYRTYCELKKTLDINKIKIFQLNHLGFISEYQRNSLIDKGYNNILEDYKKYEDLYNTTKTRIKYRLQIDKSLELKIDLAELLLFEYYYKNRNKRYHKNIESEDQKARYYHYREVNFLADALQKKFNENELDRFKYYEDNPLLSFQFENQDLYKKYKNEYLPYCKEKKLEFMRIKDTEEIETRSLLLKEDIYDNSEQKNTSDNIKKQIIKETVSEQNNLK